MKLARACGPLSVHAQFICEVLFVIGLLTRWAGLLMTFNFIVAVVMVHSLQDFRGWWPAIVLVFISQHLALHGAGRYSVDVWLGRRTDGWIARALIASGHPNA